MQTYQRYEQLRNQKGMTNYRIAKDTGISPATLSDWKAGKITPKFITLTKIAEVLGVSPTYFYQEEA